MSKDSPEAKLQKSGAFWMAFVGFGLVGAVAMLVAVPAIEQELAERSEDTLRQYEWVGIEIDGRTLVLTGSAPDETAHKELIGAARRVTPLLRIDDRIAISAIGAVEPGVTSEQEKITEIESLAAYSSTAETISAVDSDELNALTSSSRDVVAIESTATSSALGEPLPSIAPTVVSTASDTALKPSVELLPVHSPESPKQRISANECQARMDAAMRSEIIRFQSGSTEILNASYPLLTDISKVAANCSARIEVSGHTDDLGEEVENVALSLRRAEAVAEFLIDHGVQADLLTAKGYGESFPVEANTTWAGRKANRRIAFKVLQEEDLGSELVGQESP